MITCTSPMMYTIQVKNYFYKILLPVLLSVRCRELSPSFICLQISFRAFACHPAFINCFRVVGIWGYLCSACKTEGLILSVLQFLLHFGAPKPFIVAGQFQSQLEVISHFVELYNPSAAQTRQRLIVCCGNRKKLTRYVFVETEHL